MRIKGKVKLGLTIQYIQALDFDPQDVLLIVR